jgi:hypothetical protein
MRLFIHDKGISHARLDDVTFHNALILNLTQPEFQISNYVTVTIKCTGDFNYVICLRLLLTIFLLSVPNIFLAFYAASSSRISVQNTSCGNDVIKVYGSAIRRNTSH